MVPFPPLGGVKSTLTDVELETVAAPIVGAFVFVVTDVVALDDADVPLEFTAVTVNVYDVFGVNPNTVIGDDVLIPIDVIPVLLVTI